jgi:DNA-binding response OmpR family regulator
MPGRNGAEVARDIGRLKPDIPIILPTGFADTAAIRAVETPASVLHKPFRIDELGRNWRICYSSVRFRKLSLH